MPMQLAAQARSLVVMKLLATTKSFRQNLLGTNSFTSPTPDTVAKVAKIKEAGISPDSHHYYLNPTKEARLPVKAMKVMHVCMFPVTFFKQMVHG